MSEMNQDEYDRLKLNWAVQNGGMSPDPVRATKDHVYNLFNIDARIHQVLCYQSRSGDTINLGWAPKGQAFHVKFAKQDGSDGPIVYEEPIGIAIARGKFVKYQRGREGINLGWCDTPAFEWTFIGGTPRDPVHVGTVVALHNSVEDDCLFYDPRTNGINLKWVRDKGKFAEWLNFKNAVSSAVRAVETARSYF